MPAAKAKLIQSSLIYQKKMNNYSDIEKSILKTVAYFDIFQYPLTLLEVYKWLFKPEVDYSFLEISKTLNGLVEKGVLEKKFGFYFFVGKSDEIETRLDRYYLSEKKFGIAQKIISKIKYLPYLRGVIICNNVGYNNAQPQSDIDFFIITQTKRIWSARFLVTILVSMMMRRRHAKEIANRACLSFYLSESHLNLSDIAIKPLDIYLIYWLATLAPVFGQEIYLNLFDQNNWQRDFLPNFYPARMSDRRSQGKRLSGKVFQQNFLGNIFENLSRNIQRQKMKGHINHEHLETEVVVNDSMLKFHENDRRRQYFNEWEMRLKNLNIL